MKPSKTRARESDPVRSSAGSYRVLSLLAGVLLLLGVVLDWGASWTVVAAVVLVGMLQAAELARIAGRVGPPAQGDLIASVEDAYQDRKRDTFRQRVALISVMATAQDPEARIRAKRELDWIEKDLG